MMHLPSITQNEINYGSLEGETVTVHTRSGKTYTGLFACQSHSVHVFDNARTLERNENTMNLLLAYVLDI